MDFYFQFYRMYEVQFSAPFYLHRTVTQLHFYSIVWMHFKFTNLDDIF
jgi:hypothetical protein